MHALPEDIQNTKVNMTVDGEKIRDARYKKQIEIGIIDPKWKLSPRDAETLAGCKK